MDKNKLIKKIEDCREIMIYGAGNLGRMAYEIIHFLQMESKVTGFIETQKTKESYLELPIISLEQLDAQQKDRVILVAVREKLYETIEALLREHGVEEYYDFRCLYNPNWAGVKQVSEKWKKKCKTYLETERGVQECQGEYVTHVTYACSNNAGDTMLSKCVRDYLGFQQWNIVDLEQIVDEALIEKINGGKLLVIGGGGLFLPDTNANRVSGWQWAISSELLEKIKVPIIIFAVGYNYFNGQQADELFRKSLNELIRKATFVGLRNYGSIQAVNELLEEELREKIVYQPCMTTQICDIYPLDYKPVSKRLGLNIAFDRENLRFSTNKEECLRKIAKSMKRLEEEGFQIEYIAHVESDLRFLLYLDREQVCYSVRDLSHCLPDEILGAYQDIDVVIGMRGHAQMIPFGVGCKIVTLGSHKKVRWFLEDIGMEQFYVDINEDIEGLSNRIYDCVSYIHEHREEMDALICEKEKFLWGISEANKKRIKEGV